jgi:hypothetical protein
MYIGNLSDFFYKNKSWLSTQPKFYVESNNKSNNILKIGGKYFNFNSITGKLELIKTDNNTNKKQTLLNNNNNSAQDYKNENKDNFPAICNNNIERKRNTKIQNNDYNNSINNPLYSLGSCDFENNNKSNDNININNGDSNNFSFDKKEKSSFDIRKKKNKKMKMNHTNIDNNISKINKSINSMNNTRQSSIQLNTESKNNSKALTTKKDFKNGNKTNQNYYKSLDNKYKTDIKILSKRNIKKLLEQRKKENDELKRNNTIALNNNINNSVINNNINNSLNNNKMILKKKTNPLCLDQKDFVDRFFPNSESLKIKKDDSWFLKTIKNQLFRDRIFDGLKSQFHFYQDSENKRDFFKIPKINIKNSIILSKKDIFPAKESMHHKLFFDYVNKQKKRDVKKKKLYF